MTPEVSQHLTVLRQKSLAGTITGEEMRAAIQLMRESRKGAAATSAKSKATKAAKAKPINSDDLLAELDD